MKTHRKLVVAIAAAAALAAGGTGVALAVGGGGGDEGGAPLPAAVAAKAKTAALQVTGGGQVTALERDGEHGATYEVEVTKPDGSSVDVRLDDGFALVGQPEPNDDAGEHGAQDGHADGETAD